MRPVITSGRVIAMTLWEAARVGFPRGLALFFGGFALANFAGDLQTPGFDANLWWIDLRILPEPAARILLLVVAGLMVAFAIQPPRSHWRRGATVICAGAVTVIALLNAVQFYALLAQQAVESLVPVPLSLLVAAAFGWILRAASNEASRQHRVWEVLPIGAVFVACLFLFPLAQMLCFGKTDYRRPADAAVVLGARAYADGRPSDALADRVRTACDLYRLGLVKKLIFSGGPGDGAVHETEAMRRMAIQLGVANEDILVDESGLNTRATVKNSEALLAEARAETVLVVSHFYHLPRIKLSYHREGREVYTVPAKESYLLGQLPYNMLREVAALWVYYLRPLAG